MEELAELKLQARSKFCNWLCLPSCFPSKYAFWTFLSIYSFLPSCFLSKYSFWTSLVIYFLGKHDGRQSKLQNFDLACSLSSASSSIMFSIQICILNFLVYIFLVQTTILKHFFIKPQQSCLHINSNSKHKLFEGLFLSNWHPYLSIKTKISANKKIFFLWQKS